MLVSWLTYLQADNGKGFYCYVAEVEFIQQTQVFIILSALRATVSLNATCGGLALASRTVRISALLGVHFQQVGEAFDLVGNREGQGIFSQQ